jgi:two-component system, chemotaxis family, protein-glutamate methylesterase/glutaminase
MPDRPHDTPDLEREVKIAGLDLSVIDHDQEQGTVVAMTCPECHGPLWEMADDGPLRYRCRVGHAYTAEAMETSLAREAEDALWIALNTLEESAKVYWRLAAQATVDSEKKRRYAQAAQDYQSRARAIRKLLGNGSIAEAPNPQEYPQA